MRLLVGDLLADAAAVRPDGVAATLGSQSITYAHLDERADRFAGGLAASGVGPGDRVAWWAGPDLASLAGFAAVARLGAVFCPLNPAFSPSELDEVLAYLTPRLLVAGGDGRLDVARTVPGTTGLDVVDMHRLAVGGTTRAGPPPGLSDSEPHIIYLTSGTTGRPKGVVVSHRASWLRSFPGGSTFATGLHGDGGILPSFPLFHYGGWHYVLEAWHHRCAFHICERFDGDSLIEAADRWSPAALYCIPAVWKRVLDAGSDGPELDSIRHADTGTSAAPPELLERIRARLPGATTSVLYGSSEGGHHTTLFHRDVERKPGSVGRVAPPGVISLAPDGEILYRSPTLMSGYFDRPADTEAALAGGWYHTGDLGTFDDDGYLYVTGRAREVIRTGGESVAPAEVESALAGLPGVEDLAVIGLPDETWGELVSAVVVTAPGHPVPSVADLRRRLDGRLSSFKHPRRVVGLESIPRTVATGQVQRTLLRDQVVGT